MSVPQSTRPAFFRLTHKMLAILALFFRLEDGEGDEFAGINLHDFAKRFQEEYGEKCEVNVIRRAITGAEEILGVGALTTGRKRGSDSRERLTATGRIIAERANDACTAIEGYGRQQGLPNQVRIVHLSYHSTLVARTSEFLKRSNQRARVLSLLRTPRQHSGQAYDTGAYPGLRTGAHHVIIGPTPRTMTNPAAQVFDFRPLYFTQIEAMVPADQFLDDQFLLDDLVGGAYRLWLPPVELRTRIEFEKAIDDNRLSDSYYRLHHNTVMPLFTDPLDIVEDEGLPLDVQVQAVHARTSESGMWNNHVVVAPADMALMFREGEVYAGNVAEMFKWVPIVVRDPAMLGGYGHIGFWLAQTYVPSKNVVIEAVNALEHVAKDLQDQFFTGPGEPPPYHPPKVNPAVEVDDD